MSNSKLVNHTRISPNRTTPRNHAIDTITIHCTAGQVSVETLGDIFASPERQASSNYGIGPDGRIGMYVPETDRSWCSSSRENDNRAITIEVASDAKEPYAVKAPAYKALIALLVDICKRNNIKALVWSSDKGTRTAHRNGANMTVHRDFASTDCPGTCLYSMQAQIAKEVNAKLKEIKAPAMTEAEKWAVNAGIVKGYDNGAYGWNDPATRSQVTEMVYRYHKINGGK